MTIATPNAITRVPTPLSMPVRGPTAKTIFFRTRCCRVAATISLGVAPPVLFLHGNSSSKRIWTYQLQCLKALGRAFIALDLPGHGESENSPIPRITYSFPGYAGAVRNVLDELCVSAVDVVGWSLGGHVGLELLATDARVRSLLLVGAPPARPCAEVLERVFHRSDGLDFASRRVLSDGEMTAYAIAMLGGPEFVTEGALADIRRTDGLARKYMFESVLNGIGTDEQLTVETSAKPLCVVQGEREPFVRIDYLSSLLYASLYGDHIHVLRGAGHAPHWQLPIDFNAILLRFLSERARAVVPNCDPEQLRLRVANMSV